MGDSLLGCEGRSCGGGWGGGGGWWERAREGRKLESREGLSIPHCSTGVFKHQHHVWLRHEGWGSSVDQMLLQRLSFSLSLLVFFSQLSSCGFVRATDSPLLESSETMKTEINTNQMQKETTLQIHKDLSFFPILLLTVSSCCSTSKLFKKM